MTELRV